MTTYAWDGVIGNYALALNWSPTGVPTGAATALVNNGGTVQVVGGSEAAAVLQIGSAAGDSGTVAVFAGGTLSVFDGIIGALGTGTVNLSDGTLDAVATLSLGNPDETVFLDLGAAPGGDGAITVGDQGLLNGAGNPVAIGDQSRGQITVDAGGQMLVGTPYGSSGQSALLIGRSAAGNGTLTVDGGNVVANGGVIVGESGTASVIVEADGTLDTGDATGATLSGLIVADDAGSSGSLTLTGAGSTLVNGGRFQVGRAGTGALTIAAGATLTSSAAAGLGVAGLAVGNQPGGSGQVLVTGAGSDLTLAGMVLLAGAEPVPGSFVQGGTGSFSVASGASASVTGVMMWAGGTLAVDAASSLLIGSGAAAAGGVDIGSGASLTGAGLVSAAIANDGSVVANLGSLDVAGAVTGTGQLQVAAGNTLDLAAAVGTGQTIGFQGTGLLQLGTPGAVGGTITGFGLGDTIDVAAAGSSASFTQTGAAGGVLSLAGTKVQLSLGGSYAGAAFLTSSDGAGGTDITTVPIDTALYTAAGAAAIEAGLASVTGGSAVSVFTSGDGGSFPTTDGRVDIGIVTAPPAGASVTLPTNYAAGFLLGSNAATVSDNGAGGVVLGGNAGNDTLAATGPRDTVVGGPGNNLFELGGGADTVVAGNGSNTIVGSAGDYAITTGTGVNLIGPGSGNDLIASSGRDIILPGQGFDTIFATGGALTAVGAGQLFFINGARASTVLGGGGGGAIINGGPGGGLFAGGPAGNNVIFGGSGPSTIFGAGSGDLLFAGGANADLLIAGAGNETLSGLGSTGNNVIYGGSGSDLIGGGAGNETFFAGRGFSTILGGTGADQYGFINGLSSGGTDVVFGFDPAKGDALALYGYGANEVSNDLANAVVAGGNTTLLLSDNTQITLVGVTGLTAANIV